MKRILVTGATGFVGNYVISELLHTGHDIIATSFNKDKAAKQDWYQKCDYIPFDLSSLNPDKNYYRFFKSPDLLIHLAWEGLPNYKADFHVMENLPRHFAFLKNLVQNGLKDISITGTCFEYGMQDGELSEGMPAMPSNAYAIAKNDLRLLLNGFAEIMPFDLKWIRLFYMYGRGQNPASLLSQLESAIQRGDTVFNMSPGDQLRDYLPVQKVAEYIVRIALQDKVTGIINCCSGLPITIKQLVLEYLQQKGVTMELNLGHYPYSDIEPRNFWGDTSKLSSILDAK